MPAAQLGARAPHQAGVGLLSAGAGVARRMIGACVGRAQVIAHGGKGCPAGCRPLAALGGLRLGNLLDELGPSAAVTNPPEPRHLGTLVGVVVGSGLCAMLPMSGRCQLATLGVRGPASKPHRQNHFRTGHPPRVSGTDATEVVPIRVLGVCRHEAGWVARDIRQVEAKDSRGRRQWLAWRTPAS